MSKDKEETKSKAKNPKPEKLNSPTPKKKEKKAAETLTLTHVYLHCEGTPEATTAKRAFETELLNNFGCYHTLGGRQCTDLDGTQLKTVSLYVYELTLKQTDVATLEELLATYKAAANADHCQFVCFDASVTFV